MLRLHRSSGAQPHRTPSLARHRSAPPGRALRASARSAPCRRCASSRPSRRGAPPRRTLPRHAWRAVSRLQDRYNRRRSPRPLRVAESTRGSADPAVHRSRRERASRRAQCAPLFRADFESDRALFVRDASAHEAIFLEHALRSDEFGKRMGADGLRSHPLEGMLQQGGDQLGAKSLALPLGNEAVACLGDAIFGHTLEAGAADQQRRSAVAFEQHIKADALSLVLARHDQDPTPGILVVELGRPIRRYFGLQQPRQDGSVLQICARERGRGSVQPETIGLEDRSLDQPMALDVRALQRKSATTATISAIGASSIANEPKPAPTTANGAALPVFTITPALTTPKRLSPTIKPEAISTPMRFATAAHGRGATQRL